MRFDSVRFAFFFPIVVAIFWCTPRRFRWVVMLISSYYFYMCWRPVYSLLLVLITAIDYVVGLGLTRVARPKKRRAILLASLASNLGILFVFKYYGFAGTVLSSLTSAQLMPALAVVLPIGLSFHTFQSMGYAIDVYRGKVEPERHLGRFATFIVFFPQLVAGPIERAGDLLPQLRAFRTARYDRVTGGLKLMAWGLFKKVVIADRLSRLVAPAFADPELYSGLMLLVAVIAFGYQIYCDFSGYSDIAIGAADVLGVRLTTNFRAPYHSRSIREFWTRWHITLSTWFRDYVYVPLGGSRVSPARWAFNILVVFLLSGLWHGANWTFVAWGLYHALVVISGRAAEPLWSGLYRRTGCERWPRALAAFEVAWTGGVVMIGWVLFRAVSLESAALILQRIVTDWRSFLVPETLLFQTGPVAWGLSDVAIAAAAILVLEIGDTIGLRLSIRDWLSERPLMVRWGAYYALVASIIVCGQFNGPPFIYFQF
jgi:alginate O-acetyltransferase complex protein AlgI